MGSRVCCWELPASGSISNTAGVSLQNFYYAGYVQDEIKATSKLTISAGLRYETETPYTERHNRLVAFDPNIPSPAANTAFPSLKGGLVFASNSNRQVYDWYKKGFSPRLGIAYHAANRTVIRGGAGIFYAPLQISNNAVGFSPSSGFSASTAYTSSTNGGLTPFTTLSNPFTSGIVAPSGSSLGAATFLGQTLTVWDSHPVMPRSYQWNFDVQQQLPWSVLFDVAYVGNRGVHLAGDRQIDTLPSSYLSLGIFAFERGPQSISGQDYDRHTRPTNCDGGELCCVRIRNSPALTLSMRPPEIRSIIRCRRKRRRGFPPA